MLHIQHAETEAVVRHLAEITGETMTDVIYKAVQERLRSLELMQKDSGLREELSAIARSCSQLPVLDSRSADEILGYDEHGLPS